MKQNAFKYNMEPTGAKDEAYFEVCGFAFHTLISSLIQTVVWKIQRDFMVIRVFLSFYFLDNLARRQDLLS